MDAAPDLARAIEEAMRLSGVDLAAVGRAWARATPLVILVPAFGLRALPGPARVTFALALSATLGPGLIGAPTSPALADTGLERLGLATLALEVWRGVPLAIATAVPLWAATMAGGLSDDLRGSTERATFVVVDGKTTPLAVLFSLAASVIFFALGGPSRAVLALASTETSTWMATATTVVHGIELAIAIGAPVLTAAIVLQVASALIARAASPAHVDALLAPLKSIGLLVIVALAMERMLTLAR